MKNLLKGLVFILLGIGLGYLIYRMYFVGNVGTLVINSNYSGYQIILKANGNGEVVKDEFCKTKTCEFRELTPIKYDLELKKDGFEPITESIRITGKSTRTITANFTKGTTLTELENLEENYLTGSLFSKNLSNSGILTVKNTSENLNFYENISGEENLLSTLPKKSITNGLIAGISEVYGTDYFVFITDDNANNFIFDAFENELFELDFDIKINYVKKGLNENEFYFVTENGTFVYDKISENLEYFYLFKDFVILENSYIGVIFSDEEEKIENFGLTNNGKNLIINYDENSGQKYILLETEMSISKIIEENGKIYFFDDSGKKYELNNF